MIKSSVPTSRKMARGLACAAVLLLTAVSGMANTSGNYTHTINNGTLSIDLWTTGSAAAVPTDVLTGIFFSANDENLTPISASLLASSALMKPIAGETIGGNWQYAGGKSGLPLGATAGIV